MDIKSVEYGRQFLERYDKDLVIYDYTKRSPDKNPLGNEGMHVIAYICDKYNVKLIYHETRIHFLISDDIRRYIDGKIFYPFITQQHFVYFEDVIKYLIEFESQVSKLKSEFGPDLPNQYKRQEKLQELIS